MTVKACTKCKVEKPATREFFSPAKSASDGLTSWCKACSNQATKARTVVKALERERVKAERVAAYQSREIGQDKDPQLKSVEQAFEDKMAFRCPTIGIYQLQFENSKRVYVGSSKNIIIRIREHLHRLRKGQHENARLQMAYIKHGETKFKFKILEQCTSENKLEREQYWLDRTQCFKSRFGYNILSTAEGHLSIRTRPQQPRKPKSVLYCPDGKVIELANVKSTCSELGLNFAALYKTRNGNATHHKGYVLGFANAEKPSPPKRKVSKRRTQRNQLYTILCPDGSIEETNNLLEFCTERGLIDATLHSTYKNKNRHHGYQLLNKNKRQYKFVHETEDALLFESIPKFAAHFGYERTCASTAFHAGRKFFGWEAQIVD